MLHNTCKLGNPTIMKISILLLEFSYQNFEIFETVTVIALKFLIFIFITVTGIVCPKNLSKNGKVERDSYCA